MNTSGDDPTITLTSNFDVDLDVVGVMNVDGDRVLRTQSRARRKLSPRQSNVRVRVLKPVALHRVGPHGPQQLPSSVSCGFVIQPRAPPPRPNSVNCFARRRSLQAHTKDR
jgi:hypothetical protein